jgi:Contractile injection system spike tip protein
MAADYVIATGDMIQITIPPPAMVPQLMAPIPLIGSSSNVQINNMTACLQGDELPAAIAGPLMYTAPPFVTPGTGSITIILMPTNLTIQTSNQKPMLLKGATFQAVFNVQSPAMMPTPAGPQPDPIMVKPGTAQFITSNGIVTAG